MMSKIFSKKELHLVIIWENGRYKEQKIVESINKEFELVEKYKISWDDNLFGKNLTTFYGTNLPPNSKKEKHCGKGEFLIITFYDNKLKYGFVETSRGIENVNLNVFSMKEKFRHWTGGGHKIHTTNSTKETNHDLTLLFGINYKDYEKLINSKKNNLKDMQNNIVKIPTNVVGVNGWDSLEQLFYVMNNLLEYVVLRNFEMLPEEYYDEQHGDIDILVKNIEQTVYVTNAVKVYKDKFRVHYKIKVAEKNIFFDFRYVGDNYFDEKWQIDILKKRIICDKGFYRPNNEDYFYSLVYHSLIHKKQISDDYPKKIEQIYKMLPIYDDKGCNFSNYLNLLEKFIFENRYQFTNPQDATVFFDKKYLSYKRDIEEFSIFSLKNISPYLVNEWKNFSHFIYFLAETEEGKKLFIKSRGLSQSARREFKIIEELRKIDLKHFPKEFFFRSTAKINFLIIENIEGQTLSYIIKSDQLKLKPARYKENLYKGIFSILKILHNAKIVHRDIRPENLIIKSDGTPILIDFQFAVDIKRKKFKEFKIVRKKPKLIRGLGGDYAKNSFHWDDAYSVKMIFEKLLFKDDPEFSKIESEIVKIIGKYEIISVQNNFFSKIYILIKNFFSPKISTKIHFYKLLFLITSKKKFKKKVSKFNKKKIKYLPFDN
jgi:hypothetical protein